VLAQIENTNSAKTHPASCHCRYGKSGESLNLLAHRPARGISHNRRYRAHALPCWHHIQGIFHHSTVLENIRD